MILRSLNVCPIGCYESEPGAFKMAKLTVTDCGATLRHLFYEGSRDTVCVDPSIKFITHYKQSETPVGSVLSRDVFDGMRRQNGAPNI